MLSLNCVCIIKLMVCMCVCIGHSLSAGHRLKVLWGKAQAGIPAAAQKGGNMELLPVPGLPGSKPHPLEELY